MRGRNTTVISIRLEDSVVKTLQERAKGVSVGEYIKGQIMRSVNKDVNTIKRDADGYVYEE